MNTGYGAVDLDALRKDVAFRAASARQNAADARSCVDRARRAQSQEEQTSFLDSAAGHMNLARDFVAEARGKMEDLRRAAAAATERAQRHSVAHGFEGDADGNSAASGVLVHARAACGAAAADLKSAVQDVHSAGAEIRAWTEEGQRAHLHFACPRLTPGEVDAAIAGGAYHTLLQSAAVGDSLLEHVQHLQARHAAIARLNADLVELLALMRALDEIVNACGDSIAAIDRGVTQAFVYATTAHQQLEIAEGYLSKIRRRKCILFTIIILVVGLVAGVAAGVIAAK